MFNRTPSAAEVEPRPGQQAMEKFFDWDYDVMQHQRRSTRIAWVFAGVSLLIAVAAVVAVAALAPLKTVQPVFVRVDNATGAVDVLYKIDKESTVPRQDLLDKGYLARYVRAREGFFYPAKKEAYHEVMVSSVGRARTDYEASMSRENPESPLVKYAKEDRVDVTIKAISFIGEGLAQVRYMLDVDTKGDVIKRHGIATVAYHYELDTDVPLSILADNALGFAVSEYKSEPEDGLP